MLRVLDLFSGIGGFSLGLESTGYFETVAFCEIEDYPQRQLRQNWPGVPLHEDIRKLRGEDIGAVDVVCGGPPCQPASRAGKQGGASDDRWLWGEAIRLVRELRPGWICFENPPGIYDVGLADILADLESLGYANATDRGRPYIAPLEIPACALGAFHIRNRVWILAYASGERRQQKAGSTSSHESAYAGRKANGDHQSASDGEGAAQGILGNANIERQLQPEGYEQEQRRRTGDASDEILLGNAPGIGRSEGRAESELWVGRATAAGAGLSGGYSEPEWLLCHDGKLRAVEPGIPLLAHAIPERVAKVSAFGNTVDPWIVAAIGRAILEAER